MAPGRDESRPYDIVPTDFILILSTCADKAEAERIAQRLVESRTAACVNIIDQITSIYRWQERVEKAGECLLLIKTRHDLANAVESLIKDLSSYDCPEIIVVPIVSGSPQYLTWLSESINP
jgi:periplasmic divalent cation tolerance protein